VGGAVSAAIVNSDGGVRQLDARAGEPISVTADDVKDADKLARMLQDALRQLAEFKREWRPRRLYFRDQTVDDTGSTKYRLTHNFGGLVNYVAVREDGGYADLRVHDDTDGNTLVLVSYSAATLTILVEEAG
jgi:hypothetical protein